MSISQSNKIKPFLYTLFILFLSFFTSCKVRFESLKNTRKEFVSEYPRIDGYYYFIDQKDTFRYVDFMFFYKNGVLYDPLKLKVSNEKNFEKEFFETRLKYNGFERDKKIPYAWGIYFIEGKFIFTEQWSISTGIKHPLFESKFRILNDTTLQSDFEMRVYHFREYSPKPDSTNQFTN